jgi:hypothetical protein
MAAADNAGQSAIEFGNPKTKTKGFVTGKVVGRHTLFWWDFWETNPCYRFAQHRA